MAKTKNTNSASQTEAASDAAAPAWAERTHVEYGNFKDALASMPVHALKYLAQYGYAKSLQDSVAGVKKEMEAAKNEDGSAKFTPEQITAELVSTMQKRRDAIFAGTIGIRGPGAPKLSTRETIIDRVAKEFLKNAAAKKGKKLPKVGEGYAELLSAFLEKNKAAIEAEADRRMASGTDDLDF